VANAVTVGTYACKAARASLVEGGQRAAKPFLQCMLVEVVKTQVLVGVESLLLSKPVGHLPILSDIPLFLSTWMPFLPDGRSLNRVIQEQYEVSQNFNDRSTFHNTSATSPMNSVDGCPVMSLSNEQALLEV
jgi:hypothetical protein